MPISAQEYDILVSAIQGGEIPEQEMPKIAAMLDEYEAGGQQQAPEAPMPEMSIGDKFKQEAAKLAVGTVGEVTGAGKAATGWGQAVVDLAANTFGGETLNRWAQNLQEHEVSVEQGGELLARDVASSILGYDVQPEEIAGIMGDTQKVGELVADVGAGFTGAGAALKAKSMASAIGIGAGEGAFWGYLMGDSDASSLEKRVDDRIGDAKLGAVLGGTLNFVPGTMLGLKNYLGKKLAQVKADGADEAFSLADEFGEQITWGMASGNPSIQKIEADAMGDTAQKFLAKKGEDISTSIGQKLGLDVQEIDKAGEGLYKRTNKVFEMFDRQVGQMKKQKNQIWDSHVAAAKDLGGDAGIYRPTDFLQSLHQVKDDLGTHFMVDPPLADEYLNLLHQVDAAVKGEGATIGQLDNWWKTVNRWKGADSGIMDVENALSKSNKGVQQVLSGQLSSSLKASISSAAGASSGTAQGKALDILNNGRNGYSEAVRRISGLEGEFTAALGTKSGNPMAMIDKLSDADPLIVRRAVNTIKKMDGGHIIIDQLKGAIFESARHRASAAMLTKPGQAGDLDVAAFRQILGANTKRSAMAGILSKEEEKIATKGIKLLGNVLNGQISAKGGTVMKRTLPIGVQEIAINALSRDPGFMARLAAGAASRGKGLEGMLFTNEGLRTLRSIQPGAKKDMRKWARGRNAALAILAAQTENGVMTQHFTGE